MFTWKGLLLLWLSTIIINHSNDSVKTVRLENSWIIDWHEIKYLLYLQNSMIYLFIDIMDSFLGEEGDDGKPPNLLCST